ncbi:DRAXIN, partial [Cervus elaphus hippelaphus]
MLLLALLLLLELSLAGSLGPGSSAQNLPENHIDLSGPALWTPQASHHRRRGLGKKERGPGTPGWTQDGAVVTATKQASRIPGAEGLLRGPSPAGLLQDKGLLRGLTRPYPEKESRAPGSERVKKRGREHKRRKERLRLHRGRALVRGPSSLMKKAELSEDQPDGEVMPTLDMALFDWTDYEDLKPEVWPSTKKKGTCCDLREHLCTPHNRGLNNKCFDDCMCV